MAHSIEYDAESKSGHFLTPHQIGEDSCHGGLSLGPTPLPASPYDGPDLYAVRRDRTSQTEDSQVNRKLIRTTLAEIRERGERETSNRPRGGGGGGGGGDAGQRKRVPPEQTNAESFYYKKQMDNRTPMVIVLQDGEELHGIIEWYDRACIKLHRNGAPNLLVLKHNVKYMYKENEDDDLDDRDEAEEEPE
jgi:host factor-I protein